MAPLSEAIKLHRNGRIDDAERAYRQILAAEPNHAGALNLLGVIRQQQGRHAEALEPIGRAIAVNSNNPVFHNNYGAALLSLDRFAEAEVSVRRALAIRPDYADAWANLGMALAALCKKESALKSLQEALHFEPQHRDARKRMATLLRDLARHEEAVRVFQEALADRAAPETYADFGSLLVSLGRIQDAAAAYGMAISLKSGYATAHFNLAQVLEESHDENQARHHFDKAAQLQADKPLWQLRAILCGPAVFENRDEIEAYCRRMGNVMGEWTSCQRSPPAPLPKGEGREDVIDRTPHAPRKELHHAEHDEYGSAVGKKSNSQTPSAVLPAVPAAGSCGSRELPADGTRSVPATLAETRFDDILEAGVFPSFGLAYHGRDQRRLKEQFAAMYEPCFRGQPPPTGSGRRDRKRIGVLVTQRHEGLFVRCMRGVLKRLDPQRFELVMLCPGSSVDRLRKEIRRPDLRFVTIESSLRLSMARLREVACDLIYYWEVGSDAMNYFLPFARLAPLQCTGWGSMITSGVSAVGYFLSSDLIETSGCESQYTERLWLSKTLLMYESRLPPVAAASAADFGLPADRHLYVCAQNPLKLHPEIDPLLSGVLEADPRGLVVLVADSSGHVAARLKERFARRIPQAAERIVFLPRQPFGDYCRLLQLADVNLDPLYLGAGSSCYDLFSYNLPVVTLPRQLLVGRVTQACYRKMGVEDLIVHSPAEYVRKAVQVATDRDYRKYVTERIAQASDVLFNDLEAVREHERFFEEVLAKHGIGL